jgi:hypothetical protein
MDNENTVLDRLKGEIDLIPIVDAHEHVTDRHESLKRNVDLFDLFDRTYVKADFISAGMPRDDWRRETFDPAEGWKRIKPYIHTVRNTSYYRSLIAAFRDLYGFADPELTDDNWRELSDRITTANKREDWYNYVLKEKARIEVSLLQIGESDGPPSVFERERRFWLPVLWIDPLLYGYADFVYIEDGIWPGRMLHYGREVLQREHAVPLNSFDDYLSLVATVFRTAVSKGSVAVKSVAAYQRILRFDTIGKSEAERIFFKRPDEISPAEAKAFQDCIMHLIVQKTIEYDLPFQFHTGIQYGSGNVLANSNPLHLTGMFMAYPRAKFLLFHGSYPYGGELSVLAKTFPNVYLDFCWLPLISPAVAERNLAEWLDTVPGAKLEWGGDCQHVEAVYGHVLQARQVVARALAAKVASGAFDEEVAVDLAKKLLRDNVWQIYKLEERRGEKTLDW